MEPTRQTIGPTRGAFQSIAGRKVVHQVFDGHAGAGKNGSAPERYDDGMEGVVDLSDLVGHGVLKALSDAEVFNAVHLGSHGAIEWSADLDLCPDAMYLRLTGKSVEEVFPDIRAVSADA